MALSLSSDRCCPGTRATTKGGNDLENNEKSVDGKPGFDNLLQDIHTSLAEF